MITKIKNLSKRIIVEHNFDEIKDIDEKIIKEKGFIALEMDKEIQSCDQCLKILSKSDSIRVLEKA